MNSVLIHCDSFDDRPITSIPDRYEDYQQNPSAGSAISSSGRTDKCLVLSTGLLDAFDRIQKQFTARQSVYFGVAWGNPGLSTALGSIRHEGIPQIYAQLNSDNTISVIRYDGGANTVLNTSTRTVTASGFFYLELYGKIDPSNGAYELRIDGTRWLSASGLNTSSDGSSLANQVRLIFNHSGVDGQTANVDDFYISDDSTDGGNATIVGFAGPVKIKYLGITGNGAENQWTPLSGSNYTNVDDAGSDGDSSYVATLTDAAVDLYSVDTFGVINPTVKAVAVTQIAKKVDGVFRSIAPTARFDGVDYPGDFITLGGSYAPVFYAFEKNPANGGAWTAASVAASQWGAKADF